MFVYVSKYCSSCWQQTNKQTNKHLLNFTHFATQFLVEAVATIVTLACQVKHRKIEGRERKEKSKIPKKKKKIFKRNKMQKRNNLTFGICIPSSDNLY